MLGRKEKQVNPITGVYRTRGKCYTPCPAGLVHTIPKLLQLVTDNLVTAVQAKLIGPLRPPWSR